MKKALEFFGGDELRARIFVEKYALRDEKDNIVEETPEDMWRRLLAALGIESNPDYWWLLSDFRFVPGGRILHALGNEIQKCTCYNCFFVPIKGDSIEAIYDCAKEMARTYSFGGGVGTDISCLRPAGSKVRNTARHSTGAVSFMELYSLTTGTIGQHFRRGALMITIEDWHPDVLDFVKIKRNLTNVRYANISVKISDEFMEAVKRGRKWWLRFEGEGFRVEKKIDARELMDEIVKSAWACVPYDTLLFVWKDGKRQLMRIGDLVKEWHANPKVHYEVLSLNLETLQLERKPITKVYEFANDKRLYEAETESGKVFVATEDHLVYRLTPEGSIESVPISALRPGDFVAIAKSLEKDKKDEQVIWIDLRNYWHAIAAFSQGHGLVGKPITQLLLTPHIRQLIGKFPSGKTWRADNYLRFGYLPIEEAIRLKAQGIEIPTEGVFWKPSHRHDLQLPLRFPVDEMFAEFLGLWLAEGSVRKSGIRLDLHIEEAHELQPLLEEIARRFNAKWVWERQAGNWVSLRLDCTAFRLLLQIFGIYENGQKVVPSFLAEAPIPIIAAFLRGYFSGDGCVDEDGKISVSSVSRSILESVQRLLLLLGIHSRLGLAQRGKEKVINGKVCRARDTYRLTIYRGYNTLFAQRVGFLLRRKQETLEQGYAGSPTTLVGLPMIVNFALFYRTLRRYIRERVAPATILRHPTLLVDPYIRRHLSADIQYEKIVSIRLAEKQEEKVYDITVADNHTFVLANGWVISNSAEPGLIYWSTMKRNSNSEYFYPLLGTNPCSEIGLPAYGACNLAAINLYKFVKNPFTEHAHFDIEEFKKAVRLGVRFLDAVIDYANAKNKYPLEAQRETENRERRLGLGIMGLADMFFALGLRYDSEEAVEFAERIFTIMRDTAYDESINLAIEKGPFPAFDWEGYSQSEFIKRLPKQLRERIKKHGIRNVTLLTIAPTGSIGTMAGVSTGIEPIFQVKYYRRSESLSQKEFEVFHPTVNDYFKVTGKKELPPHLVTAHEIDPIMRVEMQATIQAFIDNAISSCLTRNNLILTDKGFRYIDTICSERREGEFVPIKDLQVINAYGLSPATHFYYNGVKPVYRIELEGHYYIEGTANHKVLTLTKDYELVWRRLDEIQEGEFVVMRKGLNKWGNIHELSKIYGKPFTTERKTNAKEIKIPKRITRPLARFLGYLLSDGSVLSNGNTISFTQQKGEILEDFCRLAKEIFGIEPQIVPDPRSPNLYNAKIHSRTLVRFLEYLGAAYQGTEKRTPLCILSAGREIVKEFIRGLTLDGYVSHSIGGNPIIVPLCNRSEYLIREVQQLLLNFGIESNIFNAPYEVNDFRHVHGRIYRHEKRNLYHLYVTGEDARRFVEIIGFAETRKNEEARRYLERKSRPARQLLGGLVPTNNHIYEMLQEGLKKVKSNMLYEKIHSIASQIRSHEVVGRDVLAFACECLNLLHELPTYLLDPTYTFKRVKNKTLLPPTETFDLSVPQGHHYIANGIVSHNTVNLPRDISPKAVEDIYFEAWKRGCKGITVYREGSREDILRTEKEKSEPRRARFVRPASLNAEVFKYQTEAGNVYITVSKDAEGKVREVFINIGKSGSTTAALGEALGRVLSIGLQYDVPPQEFIQQLRLIRSGSWQRQPDGTVVFSVPDAVGRALAKACGEPENGNHLIAETAQKGKTDETIQIDGMTCPECGSIMIRLGGCSACVSCSYTRCD
jgi:ribonucleotide reductase alpha subunit/intein/homing endonuclease